MDGTEHTLARVSRSLGPSFDEARAHTGLLLAYFQALYGVIRKTATPTPLYRITYDETNHSIRMEETAGSSSVPADDATDINDLDMLLMGNLRDIPILFEGESGVGKTFVSQAFMRTVFPQESSISLRLSGSTFLNNVFQPFLEGRIENGMPVTRIRKEAVDRVGAMLVDEINRGDPQNILQLLDNELFNAGVFVKLGLPIPALEGGTVSPTHRRKKLTIVGAQNPAATTDARFTGTVELDAAVDNRLMKVVFGNAANSVGSGLWLGEEVRDPFEELKAAFATIAASHLGVDRDAFANLSADWLSVYAWVTDCSRTDKPILYSALELTDLMVAILGGNLPATYAFEAGVANDWSRQLGLALSLPEAVTETEEVGTIHALVATFKVPLIFRDIVQVKKLADVLSTLVSLRTALADPDPVSAYLRADRFVSVREVAGAVAMLVDSKQLPRSAPATHLVNEVLLRYVALTQRYLAAIGYMPSTFNRTDPNIGLKKPALVRALRGTLKRAGGSGALVSAIVDEASRLATSVGSGSVIADIMAAKVVADLLTAAGFVTDHGGAVDDLLAAHAGGTEALAALTALYYARKESHAAVMGDIFQHRLARTFGG